MAKDTAAVKGLFLVKRKPGMSVAEFQDYWRTKHAPLVPRTPHLLRYVQCHVLPETYDSDTPPTYDGVAELWWPDVENLNSPGCHPNSKLSSSQTRANLSVRDRNRFLP
jgi:uncharacterized protein (TIGR02118 family)